MLEFHFGLVFIYFVYGLAFFSMGLVLLIESRRSPIIAQTEVLQPLAIFGLLHGAHEWLELSIMMFGWAEVKVSLFVQWIRVIMLISSFIALIVFAMRVLQPNKKYLTNKAYVIGFSLLVFFVFIVVISIQGPHEGIEHQLKHADVLSRLILAVPGTALASVAFARQAKFSKKRNVPNLATIMMAVTAAFACYGLTQIFVPPMDIFPAYYINSKIFADTLGFPVQLGRAIIVVAITIGMIFAIQRTQQERDRRFQHTNKELKKASEQVRIELLKREKMRKKFLKGIVIAQEEERKRIARELHDDTAQYLTALILDMASLRDSLAENEMAMEVLKKIQNMSKQMAQGVYRMVRDLRPANLDDLGLLSALKSLVDESKDRYELKIELIVVGEKVQLDPLVETVFFRVAQEAVKNIIRHAQSKTSSIELKYLSNAVSLTVKDDGVGIESEDLDSWEDNFGIAGMRERADAVGGQFNIQSKKNEGTQVELVAHYNKRESI